MIFTKKMASDMLGTRAKHGAICPREFGIMGALIVLAADDIHFLKSSSDYIGAF